MSTPLEHNLEIIPVLNKIDLGAEPERVIGEIEEIVTRLQRCDFASAKEELGLMRS